MVISSRTIYFLFALLPGLIAFKLQAIEKASFHSSGELQSSAMAVGRGFFDQYSVFCVFGSVVGCVVVPLITQSVEIVIFSAIVISLTAASHLNKKTSSSDSSCKASPFKETGRKKHRDSHLQLTKKKSKEKPNIGHLNSRVLVSRRFESNRRQDSEERKQVELDKRLEEKKMKKAKKKEERLKRKETEMKNKQESEERQKLLYNRRQKQHKEDAKLNTKGSGTNSIASLDRFGHEEPECMQIQRRHGLDENKNPSSGVRIPRFERPRLLTHPCNLRSPRTHSKSEGHTAMGLSVSIPSLSASNSSLSSSGSSQDQDRLTPPPSVWKLPPQNVEPKWNPGQTPPKTSLLKSYKTGNVWPSRDVRKKSTQSFTFSGNDIRNLAPTLSPTILSPESSKKSESKGKTKDESLFTSQAGEKGRSNGPIQWSEYSLFGPNQLDKVLFRQPVL